MIENGSLDQVRRKISRARRYLGELENELKAYDASPPYYLDWKRGSFGPRMLFINPEPLNPEWEITVGEIAFQVRSALDQAVTQVVVAHGLSGDDHRGAFPIYGSEVDYLKNDRRGRTRRDICLDGTPPEFRARIDQLQPFSKPPVREHPLWVLNSLCNADKHRYGHPGFSVLRGFTIAVINESAKVVSIFDLGTLPVSTELQLRSGDDILALLPQKRLRAITEHVESELATGATLSYESRSRVGVTFGPLAVFSFQLREIIDFVEGSVVPEFEPFVH